MMPFSDPRFPGDAKPGHFQLSLRRRPDGKLPELDPDVREELSQIIAYLEALRANIKDTQPRPLPASHLTLPEQREFRAKRLETACVRLRSRLTDELSLSDGHLLRDLALLTDSELLADDIVTRETKTGAPTAPPTHDPAPKAAPARRAKRRLALAGTAIVTVLGSAMLYYGTRSPAVPRENRAAAPAPSMETVISAEASQTADHVLQTIQRGRIGDASNLLADAHKKGVALPGLRYQAALLTLRQGYVRIAMEWISQSIAAGEFVPECLYLRANCAATESDHSAVCDSFEEAAKFAAFNPRYFFFWGEALRRYGHPAQALPQFERALLCRPNSTDTDLIRFKMGLAQIEAGADEKFDTHLQSLLAQETVPGDALLLAAAVEINRLAYPAAAEYLRRAKKAMPPELLDARLRDFFFQGRAHQPDLAAAWPAAVPAGPVDPAASARPRVAVIDPATRSLTEADPATW